MGASSFDAMDARARSLCPREDDDDDWRRARADVCVRPLKRDAFEPKKSSKATTTTPRENARDENANGSDAKGLIAGRSVGRRGEIDPGGSVGLDFSPINLASRAGSIFRDRLRDRRRPTRLGQVVRRSRAARPASGRMR
jgi:hypothetical protein